MSYIIFLVLNWIVSGLALMLTAWVMPGFKINGLSSAMIAVVAIGLANLLVKPILFILTLPLTILTFGLFIFVLNAVILKLCASFLDGFEITNWWSAIFGAMIMAIASNVLHKLLI